MWARIFRFPVLVLCGLILGSAPPASTAPFRAGFAGGRLVRLIDAPGVSAREDQVRDLVRSLLPSWAAPEVDTLGNLVLRFGSGQPATLLVASLDEDGYVVSGVTDDGFVRLHRPTREVQHRLFDQFHVGQPVLIHTRRHGAVAGVSATPSTHLRRYLPPDDVQRIRGLEDLWIDVGASSRADVELLGIRLLDAVTLRDRARALAGSKVAGPAAQGRAGALALVELVRGWSTAPSPPGTLTVAWTTQSLFGGRGLARLVEASRPQRVIVLGLALPARGKDADPRGAVGTLGGGPLVASSDAEVLTAATARGVGVQVVPPDRLNVRTPAAWDGALHTISVPVLYAQTPVETIDARDVDSLAQLVAGLIDTPAPRPAEPDAASPTAAIAASATGPRIVPGDNSLRPMVESYGVSGHEERVRAVVLDQIARRASWAKPIVDNAGNIVVSFGQGPDERVFVAHMDELGYEIVAIRDDGTATIRSRGGMYDFLYEAHPVVVHTARGIIPAVLAPRAGYIAAESGPPRLDALVLDFGSSSSEEVRALGVAVGDTATVPKHLQTLAGSRVTARSMDDRAGCAALLMALAGIDPAQATAQITFVWSVQEETGLVGAAFVALRSHAAFVFSVDTFVSTDSPFDTKRLAHIPLGSGAVLRAMDNSTATPPAVIDRIVDLAKRRAIPMTIGVTSGGTDASAFSRYGAIDVGLSWPGRYSHSPVEIADRRDLDALVSLIVALTVERW